ncbi:MAG: CpsD/CapB family tyrosine-protein kinase [Gammaproteobacteria bacterium]|nr:CpsD/CapB family tyrosine-protein kinase [Gammaproteobacteria bacterium]
MERIKKAIERARKERENNLNPGDNITYVSDNKSDQMENIKYTKTKTVDVNTAGLKRNRVITHTDESIETDAFKRLRTQVLQRMRSNNWNLLGVTSAQAGEGKSLVAINLAIALAMEVNQTVLLVDLDMRRPSVHKYFDYQPDKGLSDFILHATPIEEILFNPEIERLVILPGKESLSNSSELLSSPKMVSLVAELKNRYPARIIIFDLPPLLAADDTLAFSPYIDAMLLVAEEGKTTKEDLLQVKDVLKGTKIIGTVLNKSISTVNDPY